MASLVESLNYNGSADAAYGIMTTDTVLKQKAVEFEIGGKTCTIGGIAKGSGMIHPNLATMRVYHYRCRYQPRDAHKGSQGRYNRYI